MELLALISVLGPEAGSLASCEKSIAVEPQRLGFKPWLQLCNPEQVTFSL